MSAAIEIAKNLSFPLTDTIQTALWIWKTTEMKGEKKKSKCSRRQAIEAA